jgi:tetratricopeptide (TPR) repeat protein
VRSFTILWLFIAIGSAGSLHADDLTDAQNRLDAAIKAGSSTNILVRASNLGVIQLRLKQGMEAIATYEKYAPTDPIASDDLASAYDFNFARALESAGTEQSLARAYAKYEKQLVGDPLPLPAARGMDRVICARKEPDWRRTDTLVLALLAQALKELRFRDYMRLARSHLRDAVRKWRSDLQLAPSIAPVLSLLAFEDDPEEVHYVIRGFLHEMEVKPPGDQHYKACLAELETISKSSVKMAGLQSIAALVNILDKAGSLKALAYERVVEFLHLEAKRMVKKKVPARAMDRFVLARILSDKNHYLHGSAQSLIAMGQLILRYGVQIYPGKIQELADLLKNTRDQILQGADSQEEWSDSYAGRVTLASLFDRFTIARTVEQNSKIAAEQWQLAVQAERELRHFDPTLTPSVDLRAHLAQAAVKAQSWAEAHTAYLEAAAGYAFARQANKEEESLRAASRIRLAHPELKLDFAYASVLRSTWSQYLIGQLPAGWKLHEKTDPGMVNWTVAQLRGTILPDLTAISVRRAEPATLRFTASDGKPSLNWTERGLLDGSERHQVERILQDGWVALDAKLKNLH